MPRRGDLAKIHIAKKELELSDALYRGLLGILFGKRSAKDLSPEEVEELLIHFSSLGWRPVYPGGQVSPVRRKAARGRAAGNKRFPARGPSKTKNGPAGRAGKPPAARKKYDALGRRPGMATPAQLRLIEYFWMTGEGVRQKTPEALRHFLRHYFHLSDMLAIRQAQVTPILGAIRHVAHGKGRTPGPPSEPA